MSNRLTGEGWLEIPCPRCKSIRRLHLALYGGFTSLLLAGTDDVSLLPPIAVCRVCRHQISETELNVNIIPYMTTKVTDLASEHLAERSDRELAPSNSKSEDTPDPSRVDELTDKLRGLLNKDGVWSSEYNGLLLEIEESSTPEPPQDTCGCLCHNPDALKWGCEHCAMPPQYTTIQDVVNGTPKGQEAVQKAIDDSIKVQNEMSKEAQDTSLDEQLMEVMLYVRTTHEVEHNDNQWTREFVFSFDEAKAKINRLIVQARIDEQTHTFGKAVVYKARFLFHSSITQRQRIAELTKELGDSNG